MYCPNCPKIARIAYHRQLKDIRCARFKGTKPITFIDMKVFDGDLIEQRDDSIDFVKKHIRMEAEIKGTERVEKWGYPIDAVREAITNAICH